MCAALATIVPAIPDQQMTAEIYLVSPGTRHILSNTSQGLYPILPCDSAMNDLSQIRIVINCGNLKLNGSVIYSIHFNG